MLDSLLRESELYQYYNSFRHVLKVNSVEQLRYVTDEDLFGIGFSKPEVRRLRKFFKRYYRKKPFFDKIKNFVGLSTEIKKPYSEYNAVSDLQNYISPNDGNKHIISASNISIQKQLGSGEFGTVQQGIWTNGIERIQVAVKLLNNTNVQANPMEFLKEAAIMHSIEHENIVRLYGVVLDTDSSLWLVTELAPLRSLLECLKDSDLRGNLLNVSTLCEFISQICHGMVYLEQKRLIHRDLAARNILVFSKNKVKISDFGLSRALNVGKTYYQTNFNINLKLPIAWSSPESINFLRFTTASDVWSFAVCMWEIFSYGFQPWAGMTGQQILEVIDEPYLQRLEQPEWCPKEYYNLMLRCWDHVPSKRPTFAEIFELLPTIFPLRVQTLKNKSDSSNEMLNFRCNEQITVLDNSTFYPFWKGVDSSGNTGLFDPTSCMVLNNSTFSSKDRNIQRLFEACATDLETKELKQDCGGLFDDQEQLIPVSPFSDTINPCKSDCNYAKCFFKFAHEYHEIKPHAQRYAACSIPEHQNKADLAGPFYSASCSSDRLKKLGCVKAISLKDEKILEQALEIANKISSNTITNNLNANEYFFKSKSSLKIAKAHHHSNSSLNNSGLADANKMMLANLLENKTFSEKLKISSDLEDVFSEESKEAYNNLINRPSVTDGDPDLENYLSCEMAKSFNNNLSFEPADLTMATKNASEEKIDTQETRNCYCNENESNDSQHLNTLPLPPRPRNLPQTNRRHVRIHPLRLSEVCKQRRDTSKE